MNQEPSFLYLLNLNEDFCHPEAESGGEEAHLAQAFGSIHSSHCAGFFMVALLLFHPLKNLLYFRNSLKKEAMKYRGLGNGKGRSGGMWGHTGVGSWRQHLGSGILSWSSFRSQGLVVLYVGVHPWSIRGAEAGAGWGPIGGHCIVPGQASFLGCSVVSMLFQRDPPYESVPGFASFGERL